MEGGTYGLSACIVGDNLFWDCNTKQTILRRDAQIGNSIRVASGGTDNSDTEDRLPRLAVTCAMPSSIKKMTQLLHLQLKMVPLLP